MNTAIDDHEYHNEYNYEHNKHDLDCE